MKSMDPKHIIAKTKAYLDIPAVTGFEKPFVKALAKEFEALGCEVEQRKRGMVVSKNAPEESLVLSAHIDRNGFVFLDDKVHYSAIYWQKKLKSEQSFSLETFEKNMYRFIGEFVYAYNPENGKKWGEGMIRQGDYILEDDYEDIYFDVEGIFDIGDDVPLALTSGFEHRDGRISGQIDNTLSVALIYELFRSGWKGKAILAGMEEVGRSADMIIDVMEDEDEEENLLILDVTPVEEEELLDQGSVILRRKDNRAKFEKDVVEDLIEACETLKVPYEVKDEMIEDQTAKGEKPQLGNTELGAVVKKSHGEFNGATLQFPTLYYHTNYETTSDKSIQNVAQVLQKILEK